MECRIDDRVVAEVEVGKSADVDDRASLADPLGERAPLVRHRSQGGPWSYAPERRR